LKTTCKESYSHMSGWLSGVRRCVQVALHFCGRGFQKLNVRENSFSCQDGHRSKALRFDHIPIPRAWVPKTKCKGKLFHMSGWPIGLRRCVLIIFPFCGRGMAKRSKELRSCRSPPGFGVGSNPTSDNVPNTKCKETLSHVRMTDRSKALRFDHVPLLWAWSFFEFKKNYMQRKAILCVREAEQSTALRSGRSPLLWAWVPNTKCKETLSHVRKADRCKALRLDHIPLLWAWFSKSKLKETFSKIFGWPSGHRRSVHVEVHSVLAWVRFPLR
ncbi:hypothetical protein TNCV_308631, partial [Trichonephila clavipes]